MVSLLAVAAIGFPPVVLAQLTVTPGPGGVPIAPGPPVTGYTPGGSGLGGTLIAPGDAARGVPVYRYAPSGVPVLVLPEPNLGGGSDAVVRPSLGCGSRPCLPQNLAVTIGSRDATTGKPPAPDAPITSITDLFAALRGCWEPPARDLSEAGMQMTVRFSYRRSGDLFAAPFVTYTKAGTKAEVKQTYRQAIDAALERCGRLPFAAGFQSAIAGRPISVRFVDDRQPQ